MDMGCLCADCNHRVADVYYEGACLLRQSSVQDRDAGDLCKSSPQPFFRKCYSFRRMFERCSVLRIVTIVVCMSWARPVAAQDDRAYDRIYTRPTRFNATVNGGSGLIRAISPDTLRHGSAVIGAAVMNYDRDPGDVDLFEYSFQGAVGFGKRTEIFMRV